MGNENRSYETEWLPIQAVHFLGAKLFWENSERKRIPWRMRGSISQTFLHAYVQYLGKALGKSMSL